mmetsp:Transcript_61756/g.155938  ORF Transcript_61756/g.155938 Transcript_61756/m.155938 type:complete len:236 (-) Transcript_61756:426-1133(-)
MHLRLLRLQQHHAIGCTGPAHAERVEPSLDLLLLLLQLLVPLHLLLPLHAREWEGRGLLQHLRHLRLLRHLLWHGLCSWGQRERVEGFEGGACRVRRCRRGNGGCKSRIGVEGGGCRHWCRSGCCCGGIKSELCETWCGRRSCRRACCRNRSCGSIAEHVIEEVDGSCWCRRRGKCCGRPGSVWRWERGLGRLRSCQASSTAGLLLLPAGTRVGPVPPRHALPSFLVVGAVNEAL